MAVRKENAEYTFHKKDKNGNKVEITLYIMYSYGKYSIQQGTESSVCFEKNTWIERAIITAELCVLALKMAKRELKLK